jgi:sulfotransferase
LEYQFAARGNYGLAEVKSQTPALMQQAFIAMCKGMAESYYAALTERPVVCDKNRGWSHYYEWVAQWNPSPKMLCMVRDLRSVIASMERIYRANRHLPEGPDNPAQLAGMTVADRAKHWLSTQPVGLALQRTLDCFQRGIARDILFVKYEELCSHPQGAMDKIYEFIGEEPFAHDFQNIVKEVEEDDSHFGIFGQHSIKPILRPAKPGDWQDVLPKEVATGIRQGTPWFFDVFNY